MPPERLHRLLAAHPAAGVPDAELARRFAAHHDHAAYELLVRRHAAAVWRVCRPVAGDHHAAEDAFQSTFLALARKAGSLRANVVGWLCRVAYHAALKARRRTPTLPDRFDTAAPDAPPADDTVPLLHAELNRLADKYRLPLVLCYLHGLTQAEAAVRLGWPLGTVATRVKRGCDALRARLSRRGVAFPATLFGAGAATEATVAGTVRLIDSGASVPLPLARLTTEVLRMTTPKWPRVAVLVASGLLGLAGAVGLLPGEPSVTPKATAAPVPVPTAEKKAEYELAWSDLYSIHASPQHTRAILRLAADPKATIAFLKERLKPVSITEETAKKWLADLDSEDEKVWKPALRELDHNDPRLVMALPTLWAEVKTDAGHGRLYHLLSDSELHPERFDDYSRNFAFATPPEAQPNDGGWHRISYESKIQKGQITHTMVLGKANSAARSTETRTLVCLNILNSFNSPDADAILKDVATGHPDARPTQEAKGLLEARKMK